MAEIRDWITKLSLAIYCIFGLVACGAHDDNANRLEISLSLHAPVSATEIAQQQRPAVWAINPSSWALAVTLAGQNVVMIPAEDFSFWRSNSALLIEESDPELSIVWRYNGLLVADYSITLSDAQRARGMTVRASDYRTTGDEFDRDSDGFSNLLEIADGYDPLNDQIPRSSTVGVLIPYVAPADAPVINGLWGARWEGAVGSDWQGNGLRIDNLLVDQGSNRPDGQTEFNWSALHDGEYLYLIVYGEHSDNDSLQSDSTRLWRDDNLSLVIDGDNSKLDTYDGVNDYNWLIPLLDIIKPAAPYNNSVAVTDENGDIVRDANGDVAIVLDGVTNYVPHTAFAANGNYQSGLPNRIVKTALSAPNEVEIVFGNCLCLLGQHIWEIKIKLSDVGIKVGRAFGLELQIDDDIQGGDREARFGWFHPSGTDTSSSNPSVTGTAVLALP